MKKYFLTVIALFFLSGVLYSQSVNPLPYAKTITQQELKKQLTIVASAEMEGRKTATPGQKKAAAYIESQFREIGLQAPPSLGGYQQHFPLLKDTLIPQTLRVGKSQFNYGKNYILQPGSESAKKIKSREIVFAGYGIEDKNYNDYAGKEVKGKTVLIFSGEPMVNGIYLVNGSDKRSEWGYSVSRKAQLAAKKGAVAVLLVNPGWDSVPAAVAERSKMTGMYFPRTGMGEKVTVITLLPSFLKNIMSENAAVQLLSIVAQNGPLDKIPFAREMKLKLRFKKISIVSESTNVIGYLEGTDRKHEYVFLTAHYDHLGKVGNVIYYGADDDGSGTVSVIEMARAFAQAKKEGHGPRRTVVFMTVSGEEEGLWGSEYYSEHPVFPLDSTTVDLNTDMIGRIDPNRNYGDSTNYVYVIGDDKLSSDLKPISKAVNEKYTKLELDYKFNAPDDPQRIYYRSDHYNFARKGVPIIFFFDGIHKDYHKPTDTVDKINFDLMEKRAHFIFLTAWEMANRDEMLKRDIPLPQVY